jgi:hypothetical protein
MSEHCKRSTGTERKWFFTLEEAEAFRNDLVNTAYHGDLAHLCPRCGFFHLSKLEWLESSATEMIHELNLEAEQRNFYALAIAVSFPTKTGLVFQNEKDNEVGLRNMIVDGGVPIGILAIIRTAHGQHDSSHDDPKRNYADRFLEEAYQVLECIRRFELKISKRHPVLPKDSVTSRASALRWSSRFLSRWPSVPLRRVAWVSLKI